MSHHAERTARNVRPVNQPPIMAKVEYERNLDESSRPLLIGGRTDKYKQVFTIEEDGTSKVEKFGHWLSRGRYCKIILDGQTIQTEHK